MSKYKIVFDKTKDKKYIGCPYCDVVFVDRSYQGGGISISIGDSGDGEGLDGHIMNIHHKIWISKGGRGRYMNIDRFRAM